MNKRKLVYAIPHLRSLHDYGPCAACADGSATSGSFVYNCDPGSNENQQALGACNPGSVNTGSGSCTAGEVPADQNPADCNVGTYATGSPPATNCIVGPSA